MAGDLLIFVSCGQRTEAEKALGEKIERKVNSTPGFRAYYAENVQSLDALTNDIFQNLQTCSGLIAILHERGVITQNGKNTVTSSIWINQEIAILAFRQFFESTTFPILMFKEKGVTLEGALASLITNPIEFENDDQVLVKVQLWLNTQRFPPNDSARQQAFEEKIQALTETDWMVIECLFALGENDVTEGEIKGRLRSRHGMNKTEAKQSLDDARTRFAATNLVQLHGIGPTGNTMSINENWKWLLRRELNRHSC